jgi:hypothetical protein
MGFFQQQMYRKSISRISLPKKAKDHPGQHCADQFHDLVLDVVHIDDDDLHGLAHTIVFVHKAENPGEEVDRTDGLPIEFKILTTFLKFGK